MKKRIRRIIIFANGALHKEFLEEILPTDYLIGVDRAAYWLITHRKIPDIAIGDFDSTSARELAVIKNKVKLVQEYPAKKNETDLESAIKWAIIQRPREVIMFGASGERLDHTITAVNLLEKFYAKNIPAVVRDRHNEIALAGGKRSIDSHKDFKYFSVIAYSESIRVTLQNFVYDVAQLTIRKGESVGVSNELQKTKAFIHIHDGMALLIRSRDK